MADNFHVRNVKLFLISSHRLFGPAAGTVLRRCFASLRPATASELTNAGQYDATPLTKGTYLDGVWRARPQDMEGWDVDRTILRIAIPGSQSLVDVFDDQTLHSVLEGAMGTYLPAEAGYVRAVWNLTVGRESAWRPGATSTLGAYGLVQFMPVVRSHYTRFKPGKLPNPPGAPLVADTLQRARSAHEAALTSQVPGQFNKAILDQPKFAIPFGVYHAHVSVADYLGSKVFSRAVANGTPLPPISDRWHPVIGAFAFGRGGAGAANLFWKVGVRRDDDPILAVGRIARKSAKSNAEIAALCATLMLALSAYE